jgi:hypothetical protein
MQAEFLTSSTAKLALGRREGERDADDLLVILVGDITPAA